MTFLLATVVSTPAWAQDKWVATAKFNGVVVNGHEFHTVTVTNLGRAGCAAQVKLSFTAPQVKPQWLNYVPTITFSNGKVVTLRPMKNAAPGARSGTQEIYSRKEGCWLKPVLKVTRLAVKGCLGGDCSPVPKVNRKPCPKGHARYLDKCVKVKGQSFCRYRCWCSPKVKRFQKIPPKCLAVVTLWSPGRDQCGNGQAAASNKSIGICKKRTGRPFKDCNCETKLLKSK